MSKVKLTIDNNTMTVTLGASVSSLTLDAVKTKYEALGYTIVLSLGN